MAVSKNKTKKTITIGITLKIEKTLNSDNILYPKPIKIFNNVWPLIMFANNLIAKLNTLDVCDIISIRTKAILIPVGIPSGKKTIQFASVLWTKKQKIFTDNQIVNAKKNVTTK